MELTDLDKQKLIAYADNPTLEARNALIEDMYPFITLQASLFARKQLNKDIKEYIGYACEGFILALESLDKDKVDTFFGFAAVVIKGRCLSNTVYSLNEISRRRFKVNFQSLDTPIDYDDKGKSKYLEPAVEDADPFRTTLSPADLLEPLKAERERYVAAMLYFFKGYTYSQIEEVLGCKESKVNRLLNEARIILAKHLTNMRLVRPKAKPKAFGTTPYPSTIRKELHLLLGNRDSTI